MERLVSVEPVGDGPVGDGVVIRPRFDPVARSFASLTDEQWDVAFERPVLDTVDALRRAHLDGARRIVVVLPVLAMSGGSQYAHVAAPSEAIRVLVKSAAKQWGPSGTTVNVLMVGSSEMIDDPAAAGPVSIAPPALASTDPAAVIDFLCSPAADHFTGQTITVDGGVWM